MIKSKRTGQSEVKIPNFPKFKSEAEEARWWDKNQDFVSNLFQKAFAGKRSPSRSITIRLPVADLALARRMATERGIGYQTVIKTILHEGLTRVRRKAG